MGRNRSERALFAEKLDGVLQKTVGVLELRGVPSVRLDEQLGIRDVLGHAPGVDGRNHHVDHATQDECRLLDVAQVGERALGSSFGRQYRLASIWACITAGELGGSWSKRW